MISVIESFEEFVANHSFIFILGIIIIREFYNVFWKHYSSRVDWLFNVDTFDWGVIIAFILTILVFVLLIYLFEPVFRGCRTLIFYLCGADAFNHTQHMIV